MISVNEALTRLLSGIVPVSTETVPLAQAASRVLAEPVAATRSQPPLPVSAMDGYAVRNADVTSLPVTLTQIGEIEPGAPFTNEIAPGTCVRIFTGAPVPDGYDTVALQENSEASADAITIREAGPKGRHVRSAGQDFTAGAELIPPGTLLNPAHIALAAAANQAQLTVHKRPRVGVLATGNELVRPGEPMGPSHITASGLYGLAASLSLWGAEPIDLGIAQDTEQSLAQALADLDALDLLITIGGASVGDHDLVRPALEQAGFALDFWRIAMRPGKPLMVARRGALTAIGLPGNPVSSFVGGQLFVRPAVRALSGLSGDPVPRLNARLDGTLTENGSRQDYMRAALTRTEDGYCVRPFPVQDSAMLSVLALSNCLIERPPHAPAATDGASVTVLPVTPDAL
jgi:molybdopterin molybdotransferase